MSNPQFPTLSTGSDSALYAVEAEDVSEKTSMDGGYVVSRAKHTRTPRKTFTTGYTDLVNADKQLIQDFWDNVARGGSVIFDWTDPASLVVYSVRFTGGTLQWKYTGIGPTQRWQVQFKLEQA